MIYLIIPCIYILDVLFLYLVKADGEPKTSEYKNYLQLLEKAGHKFSRSSPRQDEQLQECKSELQWVRNTAFSRPILTCTFLSSCIQQFFKRKSILFELLTFWFSPFFSFFLVQKQKIQDIKMRRSACQSQLEKVHHLF